MCDYICWRPPSRRCCLGTQIVVAFHSGREVAQTTISACRTRGETRTTAAPSPRPIALPTRPCARAARRLATRATTTPALAAPAAVRSLCTGHMCVCVQRCALQKNLEPLVHRSGRDCLRAHSLAWISSSSPLYHSSCCILVS